MGRPGAFGLVQLLGRAGTDEALQTLSSLQHPDVERPTLGAVASFVKNGKDDVGYKIVGDLPLQLVGQGRDHPRRQLFPVASGQAPSHKRSGSVPG
jgi:hypothetical protein